MNKTTEKKIIDIISRLDESERDLLVRVLKIERAKLYLERPRVKDDIIRAVREVIR